MAPSESVCRRGQVEVDRDHAVRSPRDSSVLGDARVEEPDAVDDIAGDLPFVDITHPDEEVGVRVLGAHVDPGADRADDVEVVAQRLAGEEDGVVPPLERRVVDLSAREAPSAGRRGSEWARRGRT